ncbi:MAG TPA: hypothetical protein DCW97_01460 [Acidobacteria bacterium]|nr:hypothetical protein [Acidobacteriota bacterium]
MEKRIWAKKFHSFKAAEAAEFSYYEDMTPEDRLSMVQFLREEYWKFNRAEGNANRKRLSRVFKIIKQTPG